MNKEDADKRTKMILIGDVENIFSSFLQYYKISGIIIEGHKIGRTIGYPTANINVDVNDQIPKNGVYAVFTEFNHQIFPGMLNIGTRPTFNLTQVSVEVHLFDFSQSIYDQRISIYFVKRIRDEIKFDSKEMLVNQLNQDEITSRNILSSAPHPKNS